MPGIQFANQLDMNGFKVTELGAGTAPTDAVNLAQLQAIGPRGYAQDVGDGAALTFTVTHNFGTLDVLVSVYEKATGVEQFTGVTRTTANAVTVEFGAAPALNAFRVLVIPVP